MPKLLVAIVFSTLILSLFKASPVSALTCNDIPVFGGLPGLCQENNSCAGANGVGCTSSAPVICDNDPDTLQTAIGCIPTRPEKLIPALLSFGIKAAGGVALLLMAFSAIQMILVRGDQTELSKAKDRFRDAAVGLVIVLLAVLILQIIGVSILNIPGFCAPVPGATCP